MEPKYSMSVYAAVLTVALLLLVIAGFSVVTFLLASGLLVYGFLLDLANLLMERRFTKRTGRRGSVSRMRLRRIVRAQWLGAGTVVIATTARLASTDTHPLSDSASFARASIVALAVASLGVFASSLFDWYWILPRVAGNVCLPPCEAGGQERWSLVTSFWYFHRAMATAIVAIAVTGVPVYMLSTKDSGHAQAFWFVVSAAVGGVAGIFYRQVFRAGWYAFNPPIHVGDVIRAKIDIGEEDERRDVYVVDVSLQGAKYKLLDDGRFCGPPFQTKGDGAPISNEELAKVRRLREPVQLCAGGQCSGINWYCRHNPLAHSQEPARG